MKTTPYGPALATFPDKTAFYAANPHAATDWDWKTHPGSAPLGSDVFNDRTGYLVTVCHPNLGLGKDGGAGPFRVRAQDRRDPRAGQLDDLRRGAQQVPAPELKRRRSAFGRVGP